MKDLYDRVETALTQVATIKNKVARRDLLQMIRNAQSTMTRMDQESVNCRRLHKLTPHYQDLADQADQTLNYLEQHLTFAALLG
jgi:hypothetical protein